MNLYRLLKDSGELRPRTCDSCNAHTELYDVDEELLCEDCLIDMEVGENESLTLEQRNAR